MDRVCVGIQNARHVDQHRDTPITSAKRIAQIVSLPTIVKTGGMMILKNKHNLPLPVLRLIEREQKSYSKDSADFSTTELIKDAYFCKLFDKVRDTLEVEADELLAATEGSVIHGALAAESVEIDGAIAERRFFDSINGSIIGGKIDLFMDGVLKDYKFCKVWEHIFEPDHKKWTAQMNINKYLMEQHGFKVDKLEIWARFKDWMPSKAENEDNYPEHHQMMYTIDIWPTDKTLDIIRKRIESHKNPNPPPCADWYTGRKPTRWAIMRDNKKRALKLCDTREEAYSLMGDRGGTYIEERPGGAYMCDRYCLCRFVCPANKENKNVQ